ncbi:MAG: 2-succinyl-5-enolpyruvyl-6-hydroxy-3-cyclohexene-1-carboxylic-acid synthase [Cyanobacteriota bacterium ELA615]
MVETLSRLGLVFAVISPGSRSSPLTLAFAKHPQIETIPILDERSAAFFALGLSKSRKIPVAIVCTSGTAAANFLPAIIEAQQSKIPLLVLTADRPAQLRDSHAGQTINQTHLYGHYPNWYMELASASSSFDLLKYLRQITIQAWERTLFPNAGVVHLNIPLDEPLSPLEDPNTQKIQQEYDFEEFFSHIGSYRAEYFSNFPDVSPNFWEKIYGSKSGLIIVGNNSPNLDLDYCRSIAYLSQMWQYPILADCLNPLRHHANLNPHLITTYDLILRREKLNKPDVVIQIGELPISKQLRSWLNMHDPVRFIVDPFSDNFDPLHGKTIHLRLSVEQLAKSLKNQDLTLFKTNNQPRLNYLNNWLEQEEILSKEISEKMQNIENMVEGKVAWLLSEILPDHTSIFIANSMSVRYAEFFWRKNSKNYAIFCNRGANGIDGTLSTALGIAHRANNTVLLSGDLALLHDSNGFLVKQHWQGKLTIILINNQGGGIFNTLPIAQEKEFEKYFATGQNVDFSKLSYFHNIEYYCIENWSDLIETINNHNHSSIRLLEIATNRQADASWLKQTMITLTED